MAFASAQAEPFATVGLGSSRLESAADQNGALPWVEVDTVRAPRAMQHSDSWTEWTAGAPPSATSEAQKTGSMQQDSQRLGDHAASLMAAPVSLLDL